MGLQARPVVGEPVDELVAAGAEVGGGPLRRVGCHAGLWRGGECVDAPS